jgi:multidrug efflux system membrane fusion protein
MNRLLTLLLLPLALAACGKSSHPQGQNQGPAPAVVSRPLEKKIQAFQEYTGRLEAVDNVEIRARVGGYLEKILFTAGAEVKAGDPLFIIDQRPYRAALDQAEAEVQRAQAALDLAHTEFQRAETLVKQSALSTQELDNRRADFRKGEADVVAARAMLETAKLNLDYTEIRAPISGRIGREQVTIGNLVQGGAGQADILTSIVSLDPIYMYADVPEPTVLRFRERLISQNRQVQGNSPIPVEMGLINSKGYPFKGEIDFVNNRVDPLTGTLRVRAVFQNTNRLLSPGMFSRVRVDDGDPYTGLLLPEGAIGNDQGNPFVLVLGAENKLKFRKITTGPEHEGLRVVTTGLEKDDLVVTTGVMRLRPGTTVQPEEKPIVSATTEGPATAQTK